MLNFSHDNIKHNPFRSNQGALGSLCQNHSRRLERFEDRRITARVGGAATGMDCPGFRFDTDEPESLDSGSKCAGDGGIKEQAPVWASFSVEPSNLLSSGTTLGAVPSGLWVKPCSLGWADVSSASEATFWDKAESPSGTKLDASVGVPDEAGQLYLSPGKDRGSQEVSEGVKKNLTLWGPEKQWFFRMRQVLPCILDWGLGGPRKVSLCVSQRPGHIDTG